MLARSVFCIIPSRGRADHIVVNLRDAGYSGAEVSVLFLEPASAGSGSPEVAAAPSSGPIRGAFAWIADIQRVDVPSVGPIIAGGPIVAAFSSTTRGGITGGLGAFGLPGKEAETYAQRIQAGHFLLSVRTENPERSDRARELFSAEGAEHICTMMNVVTPRLFSRANRGLPRATPT